MAWQEEFAAQDDFLRDEEQRKYAAIEDDGWDEAQRDRHDDGYGPDPDEPSF